MEGGGWRLNSLGFSVLDLMPSFPHSSANPVLSALSQQLPLCPALTWHMGPCPHQAVTPVGLGRPCLPRAAHPPSVQEPLKLAPQVSMGHRPWGRRGGGPRGAVQGGNIGSGPAWLWASLWTSDSIR